MHDEFAPEFLSDEFLMGGPEDEEEEEAGADTDEDGEDDDLADVSEEEGI